MKPLAFASLALALITLGSGCVRSLHPIYTDETLTYDPLGVVANVSAWNYPWFVGLNVIVPALLTGNAVLYKPSEHAPLTGLAIRDLLHEAGHIAVTAPSLRATLGGKLEVTPGDEMAALAWSYAAALEAGIEPAVVFHEGGYKSQGEQLAAQYATGFGPGVPMLQWYRMTAAYPRMDHWLRQVEDPTVLS